MTPGRPILHQDPPKTVPHPTQPSHMDNPITRGHLNDAQDHQQDVWQRNPTKANHVMPYEQKWRGEFDRRDHDRGQQLVGYYRDNIHRYYYSRWYDHGFYGGFWYPVRPSYDIYAYFAYPEVFWIFYVDPDDNDYWNVYWPIWDDEPAPVRPAPFPYAGVFYPTDTMRDLAIEVSAMNDFERGNFRLALSNFVGLLQQEISDQLVQPIELQQYEIVVNHYQNLQDQAIELEGFFDRPGLQFSFKALLDLQDPQATMVFVPSSQDPTGSNSAILDAINQRIVQLGGDPYTADEEPEHVPFSLQAP